MVEFANVDGIAQHLCAGCAIGVMTGLAVEPGWVDRYEAAYVSRMLGITVSVVSDEKDQRKPV